MSKNITSMDHSTNFFSISTNINENNNRLSKISESLEKLQEEVYENNEDAANRRSNMNLSQMANLKNSNSNSKTISGVSNIGSITIKLSSKEEDLRTGSSKNRKFDESEESIHNLRKKQIIEHIQEENEKSENSEVDYSEDSESEVSDNNMKSDQKSKEILINTKLKKNIMCSPVPELEEETKNQIEEEDLNLNILNKKKKLIKMEVKKEEKYKKRKYNMEGLTENLKISMTKSRSGRIRKPVKDKLSIIESEKSKSRVSGNEKKSKPQFSCNCTKSNCLKSYCICYKNGVLCTSKCSCRNCVYNSSNKVLTNLYNKKEKSINPYFFTERFQFVDAKIRKNERIVQESKFYTMDNF